MLKVAIVEYSCSEKCVQKYQWINNNNIGIYNKKYIAVFINIIYTSNK